MRKVILLAAIWSAGAAQAQIFQIEQRAGAPDSMFDALEDRINAELPQVTSGEDYLNSTANAVALSSRGTTVDYGSTPKLFSVHVAVGGAVVSDLGLGDALDFSGDNFKSADIRGAGVGGAIGVGINLGVLGKPKKSIKKRSVKKANGKIAVQKVKETSGFDWRKISLYIKYMALDREFSGVDAKMNRFGLAAKYKLLPGRKLGSSALAKWNGLEVSLGFERGSYDLATSYDIDETVTESGITGTYEGPLDIGAEIKITSVSAEVWSGVQLLHALGLYGGFGFDSVAGSSKAVASSRGNMTFTGGASGVGTLDFGEDGRPEGIHLRLFLGTQIHILPFKIFAQWNAGLTPSDLKGLTVGTRLVF